MPKDGFDAAAFSAERLASIYPQADAFLGEEIQPDEIAACADLVTSLVAKVRADYAAGEARRDAHPKAHGCVTATLTFDADLPTDLTGGIFQPGARYDAVVRFSNGSPNAGGADIKGDTRGMAVKVFGVEGEKLYLDPGFPDAQDFVMISSPTFFINSARNYTRFFQAVNTGKLSLLAAVPFYLGLRGSVNAVRMLRQTIPNPLETRYWSVVPYQLGTGDSRKAIKFSARPVLPVNSRIPKNPAQDYLRAAMKQTLAQGPFEMEFLVQRREDKALSVEDSIAEWDEARAPFERVATLTIHEQDFDTPERDAFGETLSFNPWHCLPAHRPLGMISRTRRVVYQAIANLRHEMNGTPYPNARPGEETQP